jgi:alanyl-tRNA synthetase
LRKEQDKFKRTLEKGLNKFAKLAENAKEISGEDAFLLFQSYGFPIEMTEELAAEKDIKVDVVGFNAEYEKHQELSRIGAEKKFKGGLSDASEETTKLHTATHLLNEALRRVLKEDVKQRGSNITADRLRFDFNFDRKLTAEELTAVEEEVNRVISSGVPVVREEMKLQDALDSGAHGEFGAKYPEKVSVYTVGDYSKEICMGPHVSNISELGVFKIKKEGSSSAGVRRIKAILE